MKQSLRLQGLLILIILPALACGPATARVTPTPTKTPRLIRTVEPLSTGAEGQQEVSPTETLASPPTSTPLPPTETPVPEPPTETPIPEPPTETPLPPTNTPPPPPPPTQPPPPPPTNTPAPPPPAQPAANTGPEVIVQLPDGNTFDPGDGFTMIIIVRDPDGVTSFTWGVFTQNQTPLVGGEQKCGGATECRFDDKFDAPPISGTYLAGADAVDTKGATSRGVGEIYVR